MKYLAIEVDNNPICKRPTIWVYKDDGYRFYVRWHSGPEINLSGEWGCVMEYKHCDYGQDALIRHISLNWYDSEEKSLEKTVKQWQEPIWMEK